MWVVPIKRCSDCIHFTDLHGGFCKLGCATFSYLRACEDDFEQVVKVVPEGPEAGYVWRRGWTRKDGIEVKGHFVKKRLLMPRG